MGAVNIKKYALSGIYAKYARLMPVSDEIFERNFL